MKAFFYYLFNKKEKYQGCTCDCDCGCYGHYKWKEYTKVRDWKPFGKMYLKFIPEPPKG
jgi:hypothetical protein